MWPCFTPGAWPPGGWGRRSGWCTPRSCSPSGCTSSPGSTPGWPASSTAPPSPASSSRPGSWPSTTGSAPPSPSWWPTCSTERSWAASITCPAEGGGSLEDVHHAVVAHPGGSVAAVGAHPEDDVRRPEIGEVPLAGDQHLAALAIEGDLLEQEEAGAVAAADLAVDPGGAPEVGAEPVNQQIHVAREHHRHRGSGRHLGGAKAQPLGGEPLEPRRAEHRGHRPAERLHHSAEPPRAGAAGVAGEEVLLQGVLPVLGEVAAPVGGQGVEGGVLAHVVSSRQACSRCSVRWRITRTFPGLSSRAVPTSSADRSSWK